MYRDVAIKNAKNACQWNLYHGVSRIAQQHSVLPTPQVSAGLRHCMYTPKRRTYLVGSLGCTCPKFGSLQTHVVRRMCAARWLRAEICSLCPPCSSLQESAAGNQTFCVGHMMDEPQCKRTNSQILLVFNYMIICLGSAVFGEQQGGSNSVLPAEGRKCHRVTCRHKCAYIRHFRALQRSFLPVWWLAT